MMHYPILLHRRIQRPVRIQSIFFVLLLLVATGAGFVLLQPTVAVAAPSPPVPPSAPAAPTAPSVPSVQAEQSATAPAETATTEAETADAALVGEWQGVIQLPGQSLDIIFEFTEQADGKLGGIADIPAQGAYGLRLQDVTVDAANVRFAFTDIPAAVEGALTAEGTIEGTFHQAGMEFAFHARRDGSEQPDEEQLATIRYVVEAAMRDWDVSGAALAVVYDGAVVMAEGFGLRDVEQQLPVTPTTSFGIGSATKAFTATALQMLVDEGALRWEQPLREIIPGFRLHDPFATEHASALDFALHRSGLPRHDMPWMANPELDVERFVAAAQHLAPSAQFRETWMYNNFGYVLLGRAIEQVSGESWDEVVAERLLQPLGMDGTTFTIDAMRATDDYAHAYTFVDDEWETVPLSELGAAAAAGAINSNAIDMGRWLSFQLNDGRIGDTELIGPDAMQNLHTPRMLISAGGGGEIDFLGYGLGWMIDSYRDHYRVHHGGNTIGYSANVAFVPGANVGVAVMTNALFSPVPEIVTNYVLDTLLGLEPIDWNSLYKGPEAVQSETLLSQEPLADVGRRQGTVPAHDLSDYAGTFEHPAYGELEIIADGEQLRAVYYELDIPLEHWHFEQFRGPWSAYVPQDVPFLFETGTSGDVDIVRVGFEPMVKPIEFVRQLDQTLHDATYLGQFVGDYELMGMTMDVALRSGWLVLTVPGQPPYHLEPTREGQFSFRDHEGFGVHFIYGYDGAVEGAILIQPHGNVELKRK